jgi:hypothetical protein
MNRLVNIIWLLLCLTNSYAQTTLKGVTSGTTCVQASQCQMSIGVVTGAVLPQAQVIATVPTLSGTQRYVYTDCTGKPTPCYTSWTAADVAASCGDTINVHAGQTFAEHFITSHNCSGSGTTGSIIFTTDSVLIPAYGTRVTAADAANMPTLQTATNNVEVISTANSTGGYRFIGIQVQCVAPACDNVHDFQGALINLDSGASSYALQAHHIILDRMYIHGTTTGELRRGVLFGGPSQAVINSLIAEVHELAGNNGDTQAIAAFSSPGPLLIDNNRLEAAGENVMIGGAQGNVTNNIVSDVTVTNNYFYKNPCWQTTAGCYIGIHWAVKNLLEFKNGQRLYINGNVLENVWADAQTGFAVLFTPRDASLGQGWPNATASNITYTNNIVIHATGGLSVLGADDTDNPANLPALLRSYNVLIQNNLYIDINNTGGGSGYCWQLSNGPSNFTINHNTCFPAASDFWTDYAAYTVPANKNASPITVTNNFLGVGLYGWGVSGVGLAKVAMDAGASPYLFHHNVIEGSIAAGLNPTDWPTNSQGGFANGNKYCDAAATTTSCYPVSFSDLANQAACNVTTQTTPSLAGCAVLSSSPFHNAGSDGTDLGANMTTLAAVLAAVRR